MKLRSVAVNQFRKFTEPTRLDGISDGLNVLIGPNEMGKSTLLDAVSAVFFKRYSSNAEPIRALQNDRNHAAPVVHVEFDLKDGRYRIEKRFRKKSYARLQCPDGRRLEGGEAEHELRKRLAFGAPGPMGAKPETSGIWSVLWVRQGESWGSGVVPAGARETLHQALETEVGNVLGGDRGASVMSALVKQLEVLISRHQRRPRNEYAAALARIATDEEALDQLRARLAQSGEILDDLGRLRAELAELESMGGAGDKEPESQLAAARRQRMEAAGLEERIQGAQAKADLLRRDRDDAKRNLQQRADLREAAAVAERAADQVAALRRAAATTIVLEAPQERLKAVTRDGVPLEDGGARFRTLTPTILAIPDWGQIVIEPGEHGVESLEEQSREAVMEMRAALEAIGATDTPEAGTSVATGDAAERNVQEPPTGRQPERRASDQHSRTAEDLLRRHQTELARAEAAQTDSDLHEAVGSARRAYEDQLAVVGGLENSLTGYSVADLDARIKSLEKSKEERRHRSERLRREITKLETRVEERHQAGVHEEIGKLECSLEEDRASVAHYKREVEILTLLIDTLQDAESAAKKHFVAPILNRVHPYLRALFPDADLEVNEDLSIATISRDPEHAERYDRLSLGTREQVAVLVRLAFAELLAEQERPASVILDDSLAFSDDERLDRLFDVLTSASRRVQILVLTCREQVFRRLDARELRLTSGDSDELASA